ncbi:DNA polymerase II [archaeon]|nr:DNA polymerase II [archaeon]
MIEVKHKELVNEFLDKDVLVSPDLLNIKLNEDMLKIINGKIKEDGFLLLNKDLLSSISDFSEFNWEEFEKSKVFMEKGKDNVYGNFVKILNGNKSEVQKEDVLEVEKVEEVKILNSYAENPREIGVKDFVSYFKKRYEILSGILRTRLEGLVSIGRLNNGDRGEKVSLIGVVYSKRETKNGNCLLTLEDPTGKINVLINKNREDINNLVGEIVLDEVIGVSGSLGDNIVFANEVYFPDIPLNELKKSPVDDYAIFLSDIHVGSNMFLKSSFLKFLKWVSGKSGSFIQKKIAKKVKYVFIIGDLVDGVGIYPGQDEELTIKNVEDQYEKCAEFLKMIPKHIKIIICPGNHDALRIAEPQPVISEKYAKSLWEMDNVIMVSNPSNINIGSSEGFEGFNVLMYHGYSFDYYVSEVEKIRNNGGYDGVDVLMKFLLQKRHLAPSHSSTLYVPSDEDPLVIENVPDFFVTGHIHKAKIGSYNSTTLICSSCWQDKTEFQEKVGHDPEPSRVPLVNLQTREVKMLRF